MKLTSKCKFELMPRSRNFGLPFPKCHVINNEVWICFHYWGKKKCKTWVENEFGEEDFDTHINHYGGSLTNYGDRPFVFGGIVSYNWPVNSLTYNCFIRFGNSSKAKIILRKQAYSISKQRNGNTKQSGNTPSINIKCSYQQCVDRLRRL